MNTYLEIFLNRLKFLKFKFCDMTEDLMKYLVITNSIFIQIQISSLCERNYHTNRRIQNPTRFCFERITFLWCGLWGPLFSELTASGAFPTLCLNSHYGDQSSPRVDIKPQVSITADTGLNDGWMKLQEMQFIL